MVAGNRIRRSVLNEREFKRCSHGICNDTYFHDTNITFDSGFYLFACLHCFTLGRDLHAAGWFNDNGTFEWAQLYMRVNWLSWIKYVNY